MGYPAMAIAACFGGPMLNILLGVGLSGTYMILFDPSHKGQQLYIEMNHTLLVSGVGLFAILVGTLIVVPLNSYRMSKRVGAALILAYLVRLSCCGCSPHELRADPCRARLPDRPHDQRLRRGLFVALSLSLSLSSALLCVALTRNVLSQRIKLGLSTPGRARLCASRAMRTAAGCDTRPLTLAAKRTGRP